ncbi:cytochrome c3 family protein [Okeania sp.]|uniref:cytochrome c3 family protein n=1 Tax=Okeania sp. TaxID=3100323 RepID=UPI002B4B578C|nr:cytochrome c3 family protein [Okeania sp.]MEB3342072.1 cytochrome c3 family protein [Okeania sp.]
MTGFSDNIKKAHLFQLKTLIIGIMVLLVLWFAGAFILDQRQAFLPGKTSEGHLLFEVSCNSCHEGFKPVTNEACMRCHQPEMATDTHGEKKFRDPRWAELLNNIDVLTCTACHLEHVHIFARGVNLKPDLCMSCHEGVIAGDIPSHKGFERDGCWTAGCHNFHDHRSISTGFLGQNLNQPRLLPKPELPILTVTATVEKAPPPDLSKEFLE